MNLKKSKSAIKSKNQIVVNATDYPTITDLMREQNVSGHHSNLVHYRRDLDSLG